MKNILKSFALCLLPLLPAIASAQVPGTAVIKKVLPKFSFGLKAGYNSWKYNDILLDRVGAYMVGGYADVQKGKMGLRAEPLLNFTKLPHPLEDYKFIYFDLPVLVEYKIVSPLWIQAGPQFSAAIKKDGTFPGAEYKPYLSGIIGLEARLPYHILLGARYLRAFTSVYTQEYTDALGNPIESKKFTTTSVQIYAGFKIF